MRKKIVLWLAAVLIFMQSTAAVCAAPDRGTVVRTVSGYCLSDELYAFIQIKEGYDIDSFTAGIQSDAVSAEGKRSLAPVTETDAVVRYVFMVDLTGSMRKYADEVSAFAEALMETEKLQAFYTVATFGECFEVVSENMTDANTVKRVLSGLEYTERLTNPYTGVESALTYLDGCSRRSGDLIHLVVITDGDPDLGIEDEEENRIMENRMSGSAKEKIQNTPEVVVSTICMAEWDAFCFDALSAGSGVHEMINDDQDAAAAGEKMAAYVDGLYRIDFKLSSLPAAERFSAILRLRGNDLNGQPAMFDIPLDGIPNLKLFSNSTQGNPDAEEPGGNGGSGIEGIIGDADEDGKKPEGESGEKPQDGEEKEPGAEGADEPGDENGNGSENGEPGEPGDEAGGGSGNKETGEPENEDCIGEAEGADGEKQKDMQTLLLTAGICALVAAVGVLLILLIRKRRSDTDSRQPNASNRREASAAPYARGTAGAGAGAGGLQLTMRLEVYSGNCVSGSSSVCLTDSFMIGSAPECDVVFRDADVSPQNSRVFIRDRMIYIEDLNSANGTALGGMRIQGQNRLRSGDVISIGNVEFSFKF